MTGRPTTPRDDDASPVLGPHMIVHRGDPLNAEPRPARLGATFLTAADDFYLRCHGAVPRIAADSYALGVCGRVATPLDLSLDALRARFPQRSVTAAMQCAGNRRSDMAAVKPVSGDPWGPGAIGNAEWTGVALGDVLAAAGVRDEPGLHVAFACHDELADGEEPAPYAVSIPIAKAMAPETLLASAMNGAPLSAEHGFPLRVVTPGYAGARSPKWLASITVQDRPCDGRVQRAHYKLFPPDVTKETLDLSRGVTIDEMPLTSAILEPEPGARLPAGTHVVRGYAIATARPIVRVDVSADGGRTWRQAELERPADAPWGWTLWSLTMDLAAGGAELAVRAWDGAGGTQPATAAEIWNHAGYLSTAWHRVTVEIA